MKRLELTLEVFTVALTVILGVLSDLNKIDVPYYVFIALGFVYLFLQYKNWDDKKVTSLFNKDTGGENPPEGEEDDNGRKRKK